MALHLGDKLGKFQVDQITNFFAEFKIPLLSFVLILVSLSFSLSLAQTRTSLNEQAAGNLSKKLICVPSGGMDYKYNSNSVIVTNNKKTPVSFWVQENICDYEGYPPSERYEGSEYDEYAQSGCFVDKDDSSKCYYNCNKYKSRYSDTLEPGETKEYFIEVSDCKIGQIDISEIGGDPEIGGCYTSEGKRWEGGMAWTVYANSNGWPECSESTPTPPLTPIPMELSCSGMQLNYDPSVKKVTVPVFSKVTISAKVQNYGVIRMGKVTNVGDRLSTASYIQTLKSLSNIANGINYITSNYIGQEPGIYAVEINAYDDENCGYLCSGSLYKDNANLGSNGCETSGHWARSYDGKCSNTCQGWITVTAPVTPSLTPPVTPILTPPALKIQGRIYEDEDTNPGSVGRGGFEAVIPPELNLTKEEGNDWTYYNGNPLTIDVEIDNAGGVGHLYDIANNPNLTDACSSLSKQENDENCGLNENSNHCSKYGGFSLVIPENAMIYNFVGTEYYHLILNVKSPNYKITEAYWMDTFSSVSVPRAPTPLPVVVNDVVRCDYLTELDKQRDDRNNAVCNTCVDGAVEETTWAKMCAGAWSEGAGQGQSCSSYDYFQSPSNTVNLLVPVEGATTRNLWVGVSKNISQSSSMPSESVKTESTPWWKAWLNYLGL